MEYEKKYNKVLEQAKEELRTCGSLDCDAARQIFRLFPELAGSEDEMIRNEIIHYILFSANGISEEQEHSWIAYLEKQKEQPASGSSEKPNDLLSEWTEEDERVSDKIMALIEDQNKVCPAIPRNEDRIEMREWLKSRLKSFRPQPHWKPSEDQLRKLNQVIAIDSELWGEETKEIMKSLYNDLEKL